MHRGSLVFASALIASANVGCVSGECGDGTVRHGDRCVLTDPFDKTPPTIAIDPPLYTREVGIARLTANEPATIYYTIDGTEPTLESPHEADQVVASDVPDNAQLRFFAVDLAGNRSAEGSRVWIIDREGPAAPIDFKVALAGSSRTVSWTPPPDPRFGGVVVARVEGSLLSPPISGEKYTVGDVLSPRGDDRAHDRCERDRTRHDDGVTDREARHGSLHGVGVRRPSQLRSAGRRLQARAAAAANRPAFARHERRGHDDPDARKSVVQRHDIAQRRNVDGEALAEEREHTRPVRAEGAGHEYRRRLEQLGRRVRDVSVSCVRCRDRAGQLEHRDLDIHRRIRRLVAHRRRRRPRRLHHHGNDARHRHRGTHRRFLDRQARRDAASRPDGTRWRRADDTRWHHARRTPGHRRAHHGDSQLVRPRDRQAHPRDDAARAEGACPADRGRPQRLRGLRARRGRSPEQRQQQRRQPHAARAARHRDADRERPALARHLAQPRHHHLRRQQDAAGLDRRDGEGRHRRRSADVHDQDAHPAGVPRSDSAVHERREFDRLCRRAGGGVPLERWHAHGAPHDARREWQGAARCVQLADQVMDRPSQRDRHDRHRRWHFAAVRDGAGAHARFLR
ncbi:MAG: chitobiase/beta-hexosaminidase C-terminal domain-containing protein [Deltaproteobacteria bacterium]|nr:chitobiase/beta-hexosaminidase C-terminal domain-containing protein [Deltaproteobacteria bacterium]